MVPRYGDLARSVSHCLLRDAASATAKAARATPAGAAPRACSAPQASAPIADDISVDDLESTNDQPRGRPSCASSGERGSFGRSSGASGAPPALGEDACGESPPPGTASQKTSARLADVERRWSGMSTPGASRGRRTRATAAVPEAEAEARSEAPGGASARSKRGSARDELGDRGLTLAEYLLADSRGAAQNSPTAEALLRTMSRGPGQGAQGATERALSPKAMSRSLGRSESRAKSPTAWLPYEGEELLEVCEGLRNTIRRQMSEAAGSAKGAFRSMNLSGSGNITLGEFAAGVARLGVQWKELTGLRTARNLFRFFDLNRDGILDFAELFPEDAKRGATPERVSTPEFWGRWCRETDASNDGQRCPRWQLRGAEEKVEAFRRHGDDTQNSTDRRRWMTVTMTNLKHNGKSSSRCREIVAAHLPRGTGPLDQHEVNAFSAADVRWCRKMYRDKELGHARSIQKTVGELRETRHELHDFRKKLWKVTVQPLLLQKEEENRKVVAAGLGELLGLSRDMASSNTEAEQAGDGVENSRVARTKLAQEVGMNEQVVEELWEDFSKLCQEGKSQISRKGFRKMLAAASPGRHWAERDLEAWWNQIAHLRAREHGDIGLASTLPSRKASKDHLHLGVDIADGAAPPKGDCRGLARTKTPSLGNHEEFATGLAARFTKMRSQKEMFMEVDHMARTPSKAARATLTVSPPWEMESTMGSTRGRPSRALIDFESFVRWFATSEARAR